MDKTRVETFSFLALLAISSVLMFLVFSPFLQILALATVLAILFRKPYERFVRFTRGQRVISALVVVALVLLFCVVPLFILGTAVFREAQGLYVSLGNGAAYLGSLETAIETAVRHVYPSFSFSMSATVGSMLSFVSANLGALLSQTLYLIIGTTLMLIAFLFFLIDGKKIFASLVSLSPFPKESTDEILTQLQQTIGSVIRGTLLVALVRLVLFSVAFYFFGIPNALLWGTLGGIVGSIPGLGTLFVVVPAIAFLYLEGHVLMALACTIFSLLLIILVDNALTAYFFNKGLNAPAIFVIFALLGGISVFGPMGFILGPLVLSLFLSTLHLYRMLILARRT